ncbi:MAG TPA: LacI family DNA-binding transcriptional regulator [Ktedonobacteraceae bacterium]|nr:LacI family DNA-binding transcriptional regulator [Ktedonobacteraceae bacterium]
MNDGTVSKISPDQRQERAPTIQDVARHAGVAIGTVSRVINASPAVKPATRQRVLDAIRELDYSPNLIARSMTSRRTGSVGVVVPFFTRPFFSEVLRGVEVAITRSGREFMLYNVQSNEQCQSYFRTLPKQRKVDGLLVISLYPDDAIATSFRYIGMPVVLIDAYHPLLTSLVVDNAEGAYQAVKCLIEYGHRRIGFINGIIESDFHFNSGNDRFAGLCRAMSEAGIPYEPDRVLNTKWDRQGGRQAALQLLTRSNRPTAIFAASDVQAVGVLEAARSLHLSVPADLSVIGFDGIELSEIMEMSTVQQPMQQMGELGAQKLVALIEGHTDVGSRPELICFQPSLVQRSTITTPPLLNEISPGQES